MKTPERWRALPRCALFGSILGQKLLRDVKTSRRDVTWRRAVTSHDVRCHDQMALCNLHRSHHKKSRKITFFKMATLTFDLWPWPLNLSEILSKAMFLPNFRPVAQTVQAWERWQTDTLTDRRDLFYTLNRWRGREKWKTNVGFVYSSVMVLWIHPWGSPFRW